MSGSNSAKFLAAYNSLPPDAQFALVEKHLAPLLDSAMSTKAKGVLRAAKQTQMRYAGKPGLDLRAKKAELSVMLEELSKDIKRAFVIEGLANRFELLTESVASLANWLSDIWSVVYEYQIDFALAHECLLFVDQTLERIGNIRAGCKCALTNMYIPITLKTSDGKLVKTFDIVGAQNLHKVLEFIWRDMFLTMAASSDFRHFGLISGMLEDIEGQMGWKSVLAVFYGGKDRVAELIEDDEDEDTDSEYSDDDDDSDDDDLLSVVEDDNDDNFVDDDSGDVQLYEDEDDECVSPRRCRHWDKRIQAQIPHLRILIQTVLYAVFETRPSPPLFACLVAMSPYPGVISEHLLRLLKSVATANSDTFATALEIYSLEHKVNESIDLLDSHAYLLRPRDFHALQRVVVLMSNHGKNQRALKIMEDELMDTARAIRHALLLSYSQLDSPENKTEIISISKTRTGSAGRRERVEMWVDAITTPGADAPNPLMFAAMMMGMPAMPGMHQDEDQYTYLDFDPTDPDMEDLRAEFRPNLKQRFESWSDIALMLKNGPGILLKVYKDILELMPFLRAADATEEMIVRLQDRTSKKYVFEGLDALLAFAKVQRRKWNTVKNELRKRENENAAKGSKGSAAATGPKPSTSQPRPSRSSSSSPPPLIPMSSSSTLPAASSSSSHTSSSTPLASSSTAPPPPPAPATPGIPPPPSFASFTWSILGNGQPAAPAPAPPPPPPAAFSPFSFFFGGAMDDPEPELDFAPAAGPSYPYSGGVDDVD